MVAKPNRFDEETSLDAGGRVYDDNWRYRRITDVVATVEAIPLSPYIIIKAEPRKTLALASRAARDARI